ncbi:MAG: hypothetical protein ACM31D_16370 [Bacteroidota bacterium]
MAAALALASAGFYAVMVGVALSCQQVLFADGAAFAYIAGLDEPWSLFWSNNPARIGSAVVTVFPVWLLRQVFALDALQASLAYQVLILVLPVPSLILTWLWLPPGRRALFVPMLAVTIGIGMTTFSFPTEVAVTAATFWPLLVGALFPVAGIRRFAAMLSLAFLFAFSHSFMILGAPTIVVAARTGFRDADAATRRWLLAAMVWLCMLVLAGLAVAAVQQPHNPLIARALVENGLLIVPNVLTIIRHPALISAAALLLGLWMGVRGLQSRAWLACIAVAVVVDVIYAVRFDANFLPHFAYQARTALGGALPMAGLVVLVMFRRQWSIPPVAGTVLMAALLLNQACYEVVFASIWKRYRQVLVSTLTSPGPAVVALGQSRVGHLLSEGDVAGQFVWQWVLPYQSLLVSFPAEQARDKVIIDDDSWFVPFNCGDTPRLLRPAHVSAEAFRGLTENVCLKNPH